MDSRISSARGCRHALLALALAVCVFEHFFLKFLVTRSYQTAHGVAGADKRTPALDVTSPDDDAFAFSGCEQPSASTRLLPPSFAFPFAAWNTCFRTAFSTCFAARFSFCRVVSVHPSYCQTERLCGMLRCDPESRAVDGSS